MPSIKEEVLSFENLYNAMEKCRRSCMWKDSVIGWNKNALTNINKLKESFDKDTYRIDEYNIFEIHEPKTRTIVSTRFKDRVFQRSLCDNYLYKEVTKHFIYDNCACQIGKGTDFARKRFKVHISRFFRELEGKQGYVLKCDIKDYFGSTDHEELKKVLRRMVKDDWAFGETCRIIDSFGADGKGIGLGSQVSQIMQLAFLNDLDHIIKEKFRIRHYIRYMDDFILFHESKEYLVSIKEYISQFLLSRKLRFSEKKTHIFRFGQPIHFLGFSYRITATGKIIARILNQSIRNEKRRLRGQILRSSRNLMTRADVEMCYQSWVAFVSKGNCHSVIADMNKYKLTKEKKYYGNLLGQERKNAETCTPAGEGQRKGRSGF